MIRYNEIFDIQTIFSSSQINKFSLSLMYFWLITDWIYESRLNNKENSTVLRTSLKGVSTMCNNYFIAKLYSVTGCCAMQSYELLLIKKRKMFHDVS